jgi:hypothetical protein
MLSFISAHRHNSFRTLWNSALPQDLGDLHNTYSERVGWYVHLCGGFICAPFCRRSLHKIYFKLYTNTLYLLHSRRYEWLHNLLCTCDIWLVLTHFYLKVKKSATVTDLSALWWEW